MHQLKPYEINFFKDLKALCKKHNINYLQCQVAFPDDLLLEEKIAIFNLEGLNIYKLSEVI